MKGIDLKLIENPVKKTTAEAMPVEVEINRYTCILSLGYNGKLGITEIFQKDFIDEWGDKGRIDVLMSAADQIAKKIKESK